MRTVALIGNPNSGKTTLFNNLTGANAHVGNWPGVTVERKIGTVKDKKHNVKMQVVDLPGIYSLSPYTQEEIISRNYIIDESPDCVLNIVDATNFERNMYLTTQLLEINVPIVVALNMADELEKMGTTIDTQKLEDALGVPVVLISALKNKGMKKLVETLDKTCDHKREATTVIKNEKAHQLIGEIQSFLEKNQVNDSLFHAIKLIEHDKIEFEQHKHEAGIVEEFCEDMSDDENFEVIVAEDRYKYIEDFYSTAVSRKVDITKVLTKSDRIDRVITHKWFGIPIFLGIIFLVFHLSFSANFLFLGGAIPDDWVSLAGVNFYEGLFGNGVDGIAGPGMLFTNFVTMTVDMLFGLIGGLFVNSPAWLDSLVNDGILAGVGGVLGFAPLVVSLLLCLSILENSGYMARVAFILDRIFRRFGLSGRSFIPMIMGFSCSVPAISNTRTLSTEREKLATIRVVPFFTCGAKIPVLTSIAGAIVIQFGVGSADLITYGMYVLGIVVAIVAIILMNSTTLRGENPPFVMELPTYRAPQFKATMILMADKLKGFVQKVFTVIVLSTIVVWFLQCFDWSWTYIGTDRAGDSMLASIGQFMQPLLTPMGFGSQLGEFGWVFGVSALAGLVAKENVPAMFATLSALVPTVAIAGAVDGGAGSVVAMIQGTNISVAGLIAFIVFNMTTVPCLAAVASAKAELGKKSFRNTIWFWIIISYITSSIVYTVGSWWWTTFIWLAVAGLVVTMIILANKRRDNGKEILPGLSKIKKIGAKK